LELVIVIRSSSRHLGTGFGWLANGSDAESTVLLEDT
jgi:hypothetical protein